MGNIQFYIVPRAWLLPMVHHTYILAVLHADFHTGLIKWLIMVIVLLPGEATLQQNVTQVALVLKCELTDMLILPELHHFFVLNLLQVKTLFYMTTWKNIPLLTLSVDLCGE